MLRVGRSDLRALGCSERGRSRRRLLYRSSTSRRRGRHQLSLLSEGCFALSEDIQTIGYRAALSEAAPIAFGAARFQEPPDFIAPLSSCAYDNLLISSYSQCDVKASRNVVECRCSSDRRCSSGFRKIAADAFFPPLLVWNGTIRGDRSRFIHHVRTGCVST